MMELKFMEMNNSYTGALKGSVFHKNLLEYRKKCAQLHQRIFRNLHHCKECKYFTRSMFSLQDHIEKHKTNERFNCQGSTPGRYFCTECKFSSNLKAYFQLHIREYHGLKKENEETKLVLRTYTCEGCSFLTYSSLVLLKHHLTRKCTSESVTCVLEGGVKLYMCYYCSYKAKIKSNLNRHITLEHTSTENVQWYQCDHCEFRTKRSHQLKCHIYSKHTQNVDVKLYHCDRCNYSGLTNFRLKYHMYRKHSCNGSIKLHRCDQCEYETKELRYLRRHKVNKHKLTDIEHLQCGFCNYKAFTQYSLKNHIQRKHTRCEDMEWLYCNQCEYKTKIRENLNRHARTHANRKTFKCNSCEYVANTKTNLKQHILRKHTDNINWIFCDQCEYKCKTKVYLTQHLLKHSSVKNFQCHECDQKFKRKSVLKRHILRKHAIESKQ